MKKVVVTGGNKGIGLAITKLFADNNFEVVVVARDFSEFNVVNNNIKKIVFDLREVEKINKLIEEIGDIDVLVNNAGMMNSLPFDNYSEEKRKDLMKLNLVAPAFLIREFSRGMINKGQGRIISIASIAGEIGHPDIWYGISKAGVINMTKSFAKLLGGKGIQINCVAPGPTEGTPMFGIIPNDRKEELVKATVSKRFAQPEDIAKTAYWLATAAPDYINGVCIDVNNGAFLR